MYTLKIFWHKRRKDKNQGAKSYNRYKRQHNDTRYNTIYTRDDTTKT